jgi:hypothetical protein
MGTVQKLTKIDSGSSRILSVKLRDQLLVTLAEVSFNNYYYYIDVIEIT